MLNQERIAKGKKKIEIMNNKKIDIQGLGERKKYIKDRYNNLSNFLDKASTLLERSIEYETS